MKLRGFQGERGKAQYNNSSTLIANHSLLVSALIMVPNLVMKYLQEENQAQIIPTKLYQTLMIASFISWYVIKANKELLQNLQGKWHYIRRQALIYL